MQIPSSWLRWALFSFFLMMLGLNGIRLLRFERRTEDPNDIRNLVSGGELYRQQADPYNDSLLKQAWDQKMQKEGLSYSIPPGAPNYFLYPPHVAAWFSRAGYISWVSAGNIAWIICILSALLISLMLGIHFKHSLWLAPLAFLSFKALPPALLLAQPLLPCMALIAAGWFIHEKRPLLASLLFGLASFKFTLLIPFVLYFIGERKWKLIGYLVLLGILSQVPVLIQYGSLAPEIYLSWLENVQRLQALLFSPGQEFLSSNLTAFSSFLYQSTGADLSFLDPVWLLVSSLTVVVLRRYKRISKQDSLMLLLLASFLFSYHLYYDLLLLALAFPALKKWPVYGILLLLLLYLPLNALLGEVNINALVLFLVLIPAIHAALRNSRIAVPISGE